MIFELRRVHYMPKNPQPGILYFSKEFDIAIHLCACGCGSKIKTPIGVTEWSITETESGPTLRPSVGNWQEACQSHYLITRGEVVWAEKWTPEEIVVGRRHEQIRRDHYFAARDRERGSVLSLLWRWIKKRIGR
jgi:hypothetical protein